MTRDAAAVGRVQRDAHVPRVDRRPALEQDDARQARRRGDAPLPRRGPLRPREDQEADHRVRGRAQARREQEGARSCCFIGPPGVGKTSLGRSIARSMGRRYHRIALGGVRDEAEIRGHRRTYVGALPGRILQGMKKVGVKNPVIVLDEVDKMGVDLLGDPAAALLEVLDPEQNSTFQDHYLDVPFDLSQVTFLCTANDPDTIPRAADGPHGGHRVPGLHARPRSSTSRGSSSCPKQLSAHGLTDERLEFRADGLERIIDSYTREAGVRSLEREIGVGVPARRDADRRGRDDLQPRGRRRGRREDPRAAALPAGPRRAHERARRRDGPRVDAVGRGHPLHRGDADAGQGRGARHRQPAERDERERRDGRLVRAQPREGPRARSRVPQVDRSAPARAEGRHAEGRAERRRDDVQRRRVAAPALPGEEGRRDDRARSRCAGASCPSAASRRSSSRPTAPASARCSSPPATSATSTTSPRTSAASSRSTSSSGSTRSSRWCSSRRSPCRPCRSPTANRARRSEGEAQGRRGTLRQGSGVVASWRSLPVPGGSPRSSCSSLLGAVGFLPLFGGPGLRAVAGERRSSSRSAAAIATAIELSGAPSACRPSRASGAGSATGVLLAGVAFATALLHGVARRDLRLRGRRRLLSADGRASARCSAARGARSSARCAAGGAGAGSSACSSRSPVRSVASR